MATSQSFLILSSKCAMCCLCVTPATLFNINALPNMQGFRDSEQNLKNGWLSAILDFTFDKVVLCCPCVKPDILFYITASAIKRDFWDN